jgi:hypothetical protein
MNSRTLNHVQRIQGKLDRLDETFLLERSIDGETHDRHAM